MQRVQSPGAVTRVQDKTMRKVAIFWAFALLATLFSPSFASIKPTNPSVKSGLDISQSGRTVTVEPGSVYINDQLVSVTKATKIKVRVAPQKFRCIDTLYVTPNGEVGLSISNPAKFAPEPGIVPAGALAIAHVVTQGAAPFTDSDILPIMRGGNELFFADREVNEQALKKTLAKLKSGEPVKIIFWGDSITCGANATKPEFGYAALTEKKLRALYPHANMTIKNLGIGGSSIATRITTIEPALKSFHPDMVLIEFINDIQFPIERIEPLYERVYQMGHVYGFETLYVNPFFPDPGLLNLHNALEVATIPYYKFVRNTSRKYGWAMADSAKRWQSLDREGLRADLLMQDGVVHLNNFGHEMLAEEVFKCFL
jgi:GDSL-like Lipase/Acylhydrolase family